MCSKKVIGDQGTKNSYIAVRGIFEMMSMNWLQRTVFCMVNLCQTSKQKLTGGSLRKAADIGE